MPPSADAATPPGPNRWLREREAWLVFLISVAVHGLRLDALSLRGEETRRACVAREMLLTGDWVTPREQGTIFADRPPLQNWVVAVAMLVVGDHNPWAVRLPSVAAMVLLSLVIYGYSRNFLGRTASAIGAIAFVTFGQELQLGRLGETEALFALFAASSLLIWHWGYLQGWRPAVYWSVGYVLAALAALTKGPQGPVYFVGGCGAYLLWRRDCRAVFTRGHAIGAALGAATILAWHIPFASRVPAPLVLKTWGYLAAARFDYGDGLRIVTHALGYPLEVFGCLLPWSAALLVFAFRDVRKSLGPARDATAFLTLAAGLAFVSCWLAPHARGRYFMPMHPLFGPLTGIAAERAWMAARGAPARQLWHILQRALSILMIVVGVAVPIANLFPSLATTIVAQPIMFAVAYGALVACLGAWTWRMAPHGPRANALASAVAVASFLGVTYAGVVQNALARQSNDIAAAVAEVKQDLPSGVRLQSIGIVHHAFAYHFGDSIPLVDPKDDLPVGQYFCFQDTSDFPAPEIDFAWEQVAVISCDRNRRAVPKDRVIVGRRLATAARDAGDRK